MVFGSGNKFRIKRSQSSYRREPRDREKGLPNFEGSYKRTMSPSPSCTNLTNGFLNGTSHVNCSKDIENVDPKCRTHLEPPLTANGKIEARRHPNSTGSTSAASSPPAAAAPTVVTPATCTSQPAHRDLESSPSRIDECRTLYERGHGPQMALPSQPPDGSHANNAATSAPSKMLPKNRATVDADVATAITNGESKQRSARTPRTQSDPSSTKESAPAALLSSQSSSSSLNLPKSGASSGYESPLGAADATGASIPRSQSDLSTVGSTESGYSSLSLNNVPSPSVSPTRLSSSSSASGSMCGSSNALCTSHPGVVTASPATVSPTSWSCAGIQCDIVTATTATSVAVATRHQPLVSRFESEDAVEVECRPEALRPGAATSDAASQTDCLGAAAAVAAAGDAVRLAQHDRGSSPIFRQKSQEEIDCEELCRDLISHLSSNDHLYRLLAPKPCIKKPSDYLSNVFITTIVPFTEYSSLTNQSEDARLHDRSLASNDSSYQSEAGCRLQQNEICDNTKIVQPVTIYQLLQKKEKLINRLDHRINILKAEQNAITEECRINDSLGEMISKKVAKLVSTNEAAKYKLHIEEIGHITSLLLGLSGRLAKVENSLYEVAVDNQNEKKALESKRDKLISQLEEAKALKLNIDKRSYAVSALLAKHFTAEEIAEYEYFVHMKSKLLIDSREIAEKIQSNELQLTALKDARNEEKY